MALPLGVIVHPMADEYRGRTVPVVQLSSAGIVRCRRCRTYMNPFIQWTDAGRRCGGGAPGRGVPRREVRAQKRCTAAALWSAEGGGPEGAAGHWTPMPVQLSRCSVS
jgi:hypothetical protein